MTLCCGYFTLCFGYATSCTAFHFYTPSFIFLRFFKQISIPPISGQGLPNSLLTLTLFLNSLLLFLCFFLILLILCSFAILSAHSNSLLLLSLQQLSYSKVQYPPYSVNFFASIYSIKQQPSITNYSTAYQVFAN